MVSQPNGSKRGGGGNAYHDGHKNRTVKNRTLAEVIRAHLDGAHEEGRAKRCPKCGP